MTIRCERHGPVTVITIDRPEARNALDVPSVRALDEAFATFEADDASTVAIVTGAGERAFCAGADLRGGAMVEDAPARAVFAGTDRSLVVDPGVTKPIIAAVNGFALGGGLELALLCDIRVASSSAQFGLTEVAVGSMPGSGGTQRLPRLVGPGVAMHLALTGERIDAAEALRIGLVTRLCEPASLMEEAMAIALRIDANAPLSVRAVKKAIRSGLDMTLAEGLAFERALFNILRDSEDRQEGRLAFREKRKPAWRGL
ncbi:MAG: enoyl-CoA hydratase-related protein [Aquamicrobium sp.]|uniref:enoyl-CoA hydratase/isomerase family protein n=1 Tax=Aquamicrobium sp. TaxID=1872579 RepID=UPI00349EF503|nr:enoyl-CoA hydratase-related protein [Aquamicrobium sp.]